MAGEEHSEGGLAFHPLEQFEIHRLFGEGPISWYTPTNATLWMALALAAIVLVFVMGSASRTMIPTRMQSLGRDGL